MQLTVTIPTAARDAKPGQTLWHGDKQWLIDELALKTDGIRISMRQLVHGVAQDGRRTVLEPHPDDVLEVEPTHDQLDGIGRYIAHVLGQQWTVAVKGWLIDNPEHSHRVGQAYSLTEANHDLRVDHQLIRDDGTLVVVPTDDNRLEATIAERDRFYEHSVLLNWLGIMLARATGHDVPDGQRLDVDDIAVLRDWLQLVVNQRDDAKATVDAAVEEVNRLVVRVRELEALHIAPPLSVHGGWDSIPLGGTPLSDQAHATPGVTVTSRPDREATVSQASEPLLPSVPHTFKARMVPTGKYTAGGEVERVASHLCECGMPSHARIHSRYQVPAEFDPRTQQRPQIVDGEPNAELRDAVVLSADAICPESGLPAADCTIVHDHLMPSDEPADPELEATLAELDGDTAPAVNPAPTAEDVYDAIPTTPLGRGKDAGL